MFRTPTDAWVAAFVHARRSGRDGWTWPGEPPALGRRPPAGFQARAARWPALSGLLLAVLGAAALALAGGRSLASSAWGLAAWAIVGAVAALSTVRLVLAVRSVVVADGERLRVRQPFGAVALPWSAVAEVTCPPPTPVAAGMGCAGCWRVMIVVELRDGSRLAPYALRRTTRLRSLAAVERIVGDWWDLRQLWLRYGPPAAPAMWGRETSDPPSEG